MKNNPDCRKCMYSNSLYRFQHICCTHPMLSMRDVTIGRVWRRLSLVANDNGLRNGWFAWPFNFDPFWLENCDGFSERPSSVSSCCRDRINVIDRDGEELEYESGNWKRVRHFKCRKCGKKCNVAYWDADKQDFHVPTKSIIKPRRGKLARLLDR